MPAPQKIKGLVLYQVATPLQDFRAIAYALRSRFRARLGETGFLPGVGGS